MSTLPVERQSDVRLVALAKAGDTRAMETLINRYRFLVRNRTRNHFILGAEQEDILQEGLIGLYKAVRDFNIDKFTSFRGFAQVCIDRQMITAIKAASRLKHSAHNRAVSIDKPVTDDGEASLADFLPTPKDEDPSEVVCAREATTKLLELVNDNLTPLELTVLTSYLEGASYAEIAAEHQRTTKSIDNALQRVKAKMTRRFPDKIAALTTTTRPGANASRA